MQHYFVIKIENTLFFKEEDIHHIINVMQFKNSELIVGIIENEGKYLASLNISKNQVNATIIKKIDSENELTSKVILIYSLVKQEKFELVLQKATELGVFEIIPFASSRSIVKIDKNDEDKKIIRWQKIIKEASEQSRRIKQPHIKNIHKLDEIIKVEADIKLVAYEKEFNFGSSKLYQMLSSTSLENKTICIVIGAEGGFEEKEIKKLNENGFVNVSLGKRILRSETAAIYALSIISFMCERND